MSSSTHRSTAVATAVLVAGASLLGACGATDDPSTGTVELTVSAAASLAPAVADLEQTYESTHPGVDVRFNLGGSTLLANQVREGAPTDLIVTADLATATVLAGEGLAGTPTPIARNHLAIVTAPDRADAVTSLADLATLDVVALCAPEVPCGRLAREVLDRAGVTLPSDHVAEGPDVAATLRAVTFGDADAAIVYETDAASAGGQVAVVPIPSDIDVSTTVTAATIARSSHPDAASTLLDWLAGPEAARILLDAGFAPPDAS